MNLTSTPCRHFWKIGSPDGVTSTGVCQLCGERRDFLNSISNAMIEKAKQKKRKPMPSYHNNNSTPVD